MNIDLTQLKSKKLAQARAKAQEDIRNWQAAVGMVQSLAMDLQIPIVLRPELVTGMDAAAARTDTADYVAVITMSQQAVNARSEILTCAGDALKKADSTAQRLVAEAEASFQNVVYPPAPEHLNGWLLALGGAVAGFVLAVILHIVISFVLFGGPMETKSAKQSSAEKTATPVMGCGSLALVILGAIAFPRVVNTIRCSSHKAHCARIATASQRHASDRIGASNADRQRIQAAVQLLEGELRRTPMTPPQLPSAMPFRVQLHQIYTGKVISIKDYGAFIELFPGQNGLCHISELADHYIKSVTDAVKIGDHVRVKVVAIDGQGGVKLSRKQAMIEGSDGVFPPA